MNNQLFGLILPWWAFGYGGPLLQACTSEISKALLSCVTVAVAQLSRDATTSASL
jgi:hypothetical protein